MITNQINKFISRSIFFQTMTLIILKRFIFVFVVVVDLAVVVAVVVVKVVAVIAVVVAILVSTMTKTLKICCHSLFLLNLK